jgi:tape measure domain-containing protein
MTKVITYNNIQLSFQADTSGIKASRSELAQLTREVNNQRTPLERFIRKIEVINQASSRLSPKDVEDRIRAVANSFLEAEKKAGRYRDALSALEAFTPQLAQEARNLRQSYDDLLKTEKELAEINLRLAGQEALKKSQQESKRVQIEKQVLDFKKQQREEAAALAREEARMAMEIEKLKRAARKRERDDYVEEVLQNQKSLQLVERKIYNLEAERKHYGTLLFLKKQIVMEEIKEDLVLRKLIQDEERQNALVARRMNMYRQMPSLMSRSTPTGGFGQQAVQGLTMAGVPGSQLLGMTAASAAIYAGSKLVLESVKAYARLRDNLVLLEVQFKSTEKAAIAFNQIRQLAAESPLESADLLRGAKTLAQYGVSADEVVPTLRRLAEISSGNAMQLEGLTRAYAQVRGAGRLMGQELLQLTNAGFNPLNEMTRMTGVEMLRLRKMMEQGLVSAQDFDDAIFTVTSTLHKGQFAGQMTKQAEELSAQFNAFSDALTQVGEQIGSVLSPYIKMFLKEVTLALRDAAKMLETFSKIGNYFYASFLSFNRMITDSRGLLIEFAGTYASLHQQIMGREEQQSSAVEKRRKLFENIRNQLEKSRKLEEMEKLKQQEAVQEQIDGLKMMKDAQEAYLKATMSTADYEKLQAKRKVDDFRKEAELMAKLKTDQAWMTKTARSGTYEQMSRPFFAQAEKDIKEFEKLMTQTPLLEEAKAIKEGLFKAANPQAQMMEQAQRIADMINAGMLTMQQGSAELARVMQENTNATQQQSYDLPRTLQAGTVEAYQAMFGRDNTAKLQLAEQKRQVAEQQKANGLLNDLVNKNPIKAMN